MQEDYTMIKDLRAVIDSIISITDLSRGKVSKVVQNVAEDGREYIIVKNNEPQAVLLSVNDYTRLMNDHERVRQLEEELENLELLLIAEERLKNARPEDFIEENEVLKELGISSSEVRKLIDSVEIE
jgi:prevent-host-death family protein